MSDILDAKIKRKELFNNFDISNLVKSSVLNTKLVTLATKVELIPVQDKIMKLKMHDLNYFLGKKFFGDDGSQNIFVHRPTLEDNDTGHALSWKSKGVYTSKLKPLYTTFFKKNFFFLY